MSLSFAIYSPDGAVRSGAGFQPLDQLMHGWDEAVPVKRIAAEAVRVVAGEHQLVFAIVGVADRLQGLLDAEAAWIGLLAGRALLVLRPIRELAGRETAHAIDLVVADLKRLLRL